jgi:hypothetical protein
MARNVVTYLAKGDHIMNTTYLYKNLYFPSARLSGTPLFAPVKRSAVENRIRRAARPVRPAAPAPAARRGTGWTAIPRTARRAGVLAAAILAILSTSVTLTHFSGDGPRSADAAILGDK